MNSAKFRFVLWLMLCASCTAWAQGFPARPIRYVVPQAPGGSSDTLARVIAPRLAEALGQQVVVDNRPGATGIIGAEIVVKSVADGHTVLQVATSHATNPALGVKLPYDTLRDFAPVTLLSSQPNIWVVHPSLPVHSVRSLIALAKARPGQIDFASSGTGGSQHLAGELLNVMAGIRLTHIPYKGSPPALIDVLGGRVALMSSTMAPVLPHMKSGRVRAIAVTSAARSAATPEVPTVAESGLPGYEAIAWQGVVAPSRVPRDALQRLNVEFVKIIGRTDVRKPLADQGYEPVASSADFFSTFIGSEIEKWSKVVRAAGIKVD